MAGEAVSAEANDLMTSLTLGESFNIPDVDLTLPEYQVPDVTGIVAPTALTNNDLTTKAVGGSGTFDVVMDGILAHLKEQFDKNRITGDQFTKAFIETTQAALANSVQFLLGRDQAYWQAYAAQVNAKIAETQLVTARVGLEKAKVELEAVRLQAATQKAEFALTKLKLSTEAANFDLVVAQTGKVTQEKTNLTKQALLLDDEHGLAALKTTNLTNQNSKLTAETSLVNKQSDQISQELTLYPSKLKLISEQAEAQRAQTTDKRSDNVSVTGVLGKQKELYAQQITSYQRDAEIKATKLFTDAWITMKTIDEGLLPPNGFANTSLDAILTDIKTNNNIG